MKNQHVFIKTVSSILLLTVTLNAFRATADPVATNENLPYTVRFELGSSAFAPGDSINIKEVRGTTKKIEIGGTYSIAGTYTLNSRDHASLSFYDTSIGYSGPTAVDPSQSVRIEKGTGSFYLVKTMHDDGYLHVSFYPVRSGSDFGGVYFGQADRIFLGPMNLHSHDSGSSDGGDDSKEGPLSGSGPNQTLFNYLGNPVMPPANMDQRYTAGGLTGVVLLAAHNAGITVKSVAVDDSEYPYIVGVICGGSDFSALKNELKQMPGYEYGGGVGNDSNADGSDTCNVFCIVPYHAFPPNTGDRIYHRLLLREAAFNDQISNHRQDLVPTHAQSKLSTMTIYLGDQTLDSELALTEKEQIAGMMFRTNIQETDSMLFVLTAPQRASFWMKNCPESISAAYISSYGEIEEIHHLEKNDTTPVVSSNDNIQFVLETKDGWFDRHNVGIGTSVTTAKGSLSGTFLAGQR
ncbi:MAG TPA: DUF192 domain-containing protein [Verrucomicrobiae bacterium]